MRLKPSHLAIPIESIIVSVITLVLMSASAIAVWHSQTSQTSFVGGVDLNLKLPQILQQLDNAPADREALDRLVSALSRVGLELRLSDSPSVSEDDFDSMVFERLSRRLSRLGYTASIRVDSTPINSNTVAFGMAALPGSLQLSRIDGATSVEGGLRGGNLAERVEIRDTHPMAGIALQPPGQVELSILLGQEKNNLWLNARSVQLVRGSYSPWPFAWILGIGLTMIISSYFVSKPSARTLHALDTGLKALDMHQSTVVLPVHSRGRATHVIETFNRFSRSTSQTLKEQNEILNSVSHDLLTPLTSLRIRAEFIADPALQNEILQTIDDMEHMSSSLLEAARGGASAETPRRLEVSSLLNAVYEDEARAGRPITLGNLEYALSEARPVELRRLLRNLIDNGIRYGSSVELSMQLDGDKIEVLVRDQGPGIPEHQLSAVFKPFRRLDESRNRKTGGYGLGLTIARAIALRNNGQLSLENQETGGLLAKLTLRRLVD